jgi:hypothetical protein
VGHDRGSIGGVGVAVGTLLAAQLGRLVRRREALAATAPKKPDGA